MSDLKSEIEKMEKLKSEEIEKLEHLRESIE